MALERAPIAQILRSSFGTASFAAERTHRDRPNSRRRRST
jgi:hypothetical protein